MLNDIENLHALWIHLSDLLSVLESDDLVIQSNIADEGVTRLWLHLDDAMCDLYDTIVELKDIEK